MIKFLKTSEIWQRKENFSNFDFFKFHIMASSQNLQSLFQLIKDKIHRLGNTNRSRWSAFSNNKEITIPQFCNRLEELDIVINRPTAATLWDYTKISPTSMKFGDFMKFISTDTDSIPSTLRIHQSKPKTSHAEPNDSPVKLQRPSLGRNSSPPKSDTFLQSIDSPISNSQPSPRQNPQSPFSQPLTSSGIINVLKNNKRALLNKLIESDPSTTGYITHSAFSDICTWFGEFSDIHSLIQIYDPKMTGLFCYFTLLSDLCTETSFSSAEHTPLPKSPVPEQRLSDFDSCEKIQQSSDIRSFSSQFGRNTDDMYSSTRQISTAINKRSFDPSIFNQSSGTSSGNRSSGGRGKLDPAIFGHRPTMDVVSQPQQIHADDITTAIQVNGLTLPQILADIEKHVSESGRSVKVVYNQWKGMRGMEASDLRDGLAKDCNIVYPLSDLQAIVQRYGGCMSLGSFVRMIGDGREAGEQARNISGIQKMTADEAALARIADQIIGNRWEEAMLTGSVDEAVSSLRSQGININPDDLRTLQQKLGKMGLVDAIKSYKC